MCDKIPCCMYQKCGTKAWTRFLDITKHSKALVRSVRKALVGMHVFTGCDTISAFSGRRKMTALKQMKSDKAYQEAFTELGRSWEVYLKSSLRNCKRSSAICTFLPPTQQRSTSFVTRSSVPGVAKLTQVNFLLVRTVCPCTMHILRANYQAAIWRRCLELSPSVPCPKDCGWTTDEDGNLAAEWMHGSPAPDAVLQLLSCKCVRSCKLPVCTCLSNDLKCTDMCTLQTCSGY